MWIGLENRWAAGAIKSSLSNARQWAYSFPPLLDNEPGIAASVVLALYYSYTSIYLFVRQLRGFLNALSSARLFRSLERESGIRVHTLIGV